MRCCRDISRLSRRWSGFNNCQLAYYCQSLCLTTGLYLVFCPNNIAYPDIVREGEEDFDGTTIQAYIIPYDEERWD